MTATPADLDPRAAGAMRFRNKICIVTGAGQGIGRATARRLAAEGGKIVVAEWREESANETVRQLAEAGAEAVANVLDVSTFAGAERLINDTVQMFERVDVLVNVVGGTIWWRPFHTYTEEQVKLELERSLYTALWCCRAALPVMIAQKSGSIVNLGSHVTRGGLYRVPYAASKGAVEALTRTLAAENGRYNIRVNAVAPGSTPATDRTTPRLMIRPGVMAEPFEGAAELYDDTRRLKSTSLGRNGRPEEQASAIAFLASDDASYITGQILHCGGGA